LTDTKYRGEILEKIKSAFSYILEIVFSGDKIKSVKPIGKRWCRKNLFHDLTIIKDSV
jgi:IS5 family transposase